MRYLREERVGEESLNYQQCSMKIVEYNTANDIVVEFQDKYNGKVHTTYKHFKEKCIKNPYYPTVYDVGIIGDKYPSKENGKHTKEYSTWHGVLERCFDKTIKLNQPTYANVTCCNEWLLYENFYDWLHSQDNFDKWLNGSRWCIDKDILIKGNKMYSPDTCTLVPNNINVLFTKREAKRGMYPIGVNNQNGKFRAECNTQSNKYIKYLGIYETANEAFDVYKKHKESVIKQVAELEFFNGNITKKCYDAMINYKVEITD